MVGILLHVIDNTATRGLYNAVSPGIVYNRTFIEAFAERLRRPVLWSAPEGLVRFIVGSERSSILLRGQLVRPKRTLEIRVCLPLPRASSRVGRSRPCDHLTFELLREVLKTQQPGVQPQSLRQTWKRERRRLTTQSGRAVDFVFVRCW